MGRFVPDASATLTWCFEDEATAWTDALLAQLNAGDEATVPGHWPVEVANALLVAIRQGRISRAKVDRFFDDLRALPIRIDPESGENAFGRVFALAEQHGLTIYDAAYLELAMREGLGKRMQERPILWLPTLGFGRVFIEIHSNQGVCRRRERKIPP